MTIPSEQAESQIQITADWADFAEWICTDTRFGYLYGDKRMRTSGPLVLHSYIEGHISWPKAPQDQEWAAQFHKTMKSYQQLRLSSAYQELMDEIEEADTQLGLHRGDQWSNRPASTAARLIRSGLRGGPSARGLCRPPG